jgi:NADPH-dependent 2,4-dienoyl-CoA reductase/sulfur reductase-like enzyme/rhodanese-related sulfurtransferase
MAESLKKLRILVVGGVAGGASAATRARRVNADAEITIFEKGPVISFANCGLPYHIGGEIAQREKLLVATPELFQKRFGIHVKTLHEVTAIDRAAQTISVINHATKTTQSLGFDRLILATGAEPISPPFWNSQATNLFHLWTMHDLDRIMQQMQSGVSRAVIVGGGFVGLEVVEQLHRRGVAVTVVERDPQVLPPLDRPFAKLIEEHMSNKGVSLKLSASIERLEIVTAVCLQDGSSIPADLVIVGAGVRPRTAIASGCGLEIGKTGGVRVNAHMQTSDPMIYAVGDMVEYEHGVLQESMRVPLAGPANRAGRIAGAHAASGKSDLMGSVLGTAIVRVFDQTAACTGLNEKVLKARKMQYRVAIIQAAHHAGYYPGAQSMQLKLLYSPDSGRILGAQAVGGDGVDKRIDIIATAMHFGGTVRDLAQLDLAYAPPFGSAKDPVHMAAFTACNDLDMAPSIALPDSDLNDKQVIDVRTAKERQELPLPGAIAIGVDEMIDRWQELDPARDTIVVCHSGKRAHVAACWLKNKGFASVSNLTGGMAIRSLMT